LRAFLSVGVEASTQTLLQKGRPFILRRLTGDVVLDRFHLDRNRVNQDWQTSRIKLSPRDTIP
jgi:hypothetical protein